MFLPNPTGNRNWKKIGLWTAAAVLVVIVGFSARLVYRSVKIRRAHHLAVQAEMLAAVQKWNEAYQKAQAALQLAPHDAQSLRTMARILGRCGRPESIECWAGVFATQKPAKEELQEVINLALQFKRFDVAEVCLTQALREKPIAWETLRAAAVLCDAKGDGVQAIKFARAALQVQPGDTELRLLLARGLLATRQPAAVLESKATLWEIARSSHPTSAQALLLLANLADLTRNETKECLQRVSAYPTNDVLRDVLVADLQIRLEPQRRPEIIDKLLDRYKSARAAQVVRLARWLNQKGESKQVVEFIPVNRTLDDKAIFLVYGDALAALGQWAQLETLLARDNLPIEPVLAELYRARVATQLKKDRPAAQHWSQVHWLASNNPQALSYVAEYAEQLGETAEAVKAYRHLTRDPKTARGAYLALVRLAEQKGDTAELRALMKELSERFPEDPAPRIDLAYLELLAGQNMKSARTVAQELFKKHPEMMANRTTLALACLRQNDVASARSLYQSLPVDWNSALPGWQAVHAAVVGASGDKNAARQLAKSIPRERLKPEERALVEPWL